MRQFKVILTLLTLTTCGQEDRDKMLSGLRSCDKDSICIASYYFGEQGDKSVTRELLTGIEDERISHHIRHKGMSVYCCKMGALKKLSRLDIKVGQTDNPDTAKIEMFINWALGNKLIVDREKINTKSCLHD
jgi:hypothetical protein